MIQKGNNCRYNAFITFIYFTISPYLKSINDIQLVKLNDLILELSENVTERNYYNIIIFIQKNKFESNNEKIDEIIRETNKEKKKN